MAMAYKCGLTSADFDEMNIGFIVDYIREYISKNENDIDEKYIKMKKIQPLVEERFGKGEYPKEKYDKFMELIRLYESEMR